MRDDLNQENKRLVWDFWQLLENVSITDLDKIAHRYLEAECSWHGPDPINHLKGADAFIADFWQPLLRSYPDLTRQSHLFFGGKSSGRIDGLQDGHMWVCGTGYFHGTFATDYLTIPATGSEVNIRWGEFCRVEQGKIVETYFLLDLIDLMQQAGFQVLPPSRGADGLYPPPRAKDGILLDAQDAQTSAYTL